MLIRQATSADLSRIEALLSTLGLPTAGILDHLDGFSLAEDGGLLGLTGLEQHGAAGLLRSVAVVPSARGRGIAAQLVGHALTQAQASNLQELYLLTTTAADYFPRFGFREVPRSAAPTALLASREFQDACPQSAVLMHLALAPTFQEEPMTQLQTQMQTIPGLSEQTDTHTLLDTLRTQPQLPLEFWLHGEVLVGPGYHVTEVKAVTIEAMDCGGRADSWRETVIQLQDGSAEEVKVGFLTTRKFLAIYDRVVKHIPVRGEAEVRFEYGNSIVPAMQYHVTHLEPQAERIIVHLKTPVVQCKASDVCGTPASTSAASGGCAPESGCCSPAAAELITLS